MFEDYQVRKPNRKDYLKNQKHKSEETFENRFFVQFQISLFFTLIPPIDFPIFAIKKNVYISFI